MEHMMPDQVTKLEEQVAHLERICEDLSAMVAKQGQEIERLTRHTAMLMQREASREAAGTGGVILGDERPPHY